jgi:CHASE2 domain-containing sensor protein
MFDEEGYKKLKERNKEFEIINYSRKQGQYTIIDVDELNQTDLSILKNKIVLLGFLGPDLNTKVLEENRFTPMNKKYSGKSFPDMYGVVIHANFISSILARDYINKVPFWLSIVIAFIICFIHIFFFIKYYVRHHKFYHLVTKLIQLFTFVLMVYVSFMFLSWFGLDVDMGAILGSIALSVDVIYFYDGFVTWLHEKYGYETVFGHH